MSEIEECLREAEARLEIGRHYGNPYPRPVYNPPDAFVHSTQRGKDKTAAAQSTASPIYTRSIRR